MMVPLDPNQRRGRRLQLRLASGTTRKCGFEPRSGDCASRPGAAKSASFFGAVALRQLEKKRQWKTICRGQWPTVLRWAQLPLLPVGHSLLACGPLTQAAVSTGQRAPGRQRGTSTRLRLVPRVPTNSGIPAGIRNQESDSKSDLRNHQAIVQPRLYDSLMVTQITLKTEGPHGLPSGRQTEADSDPLYRGLIILTDYDSGHASHSRGLSRARTQRLDRRRRRF